MNIFSNFGGAWEQQHLRSERAILVGASGSTMGREAESSTSIVATLMDLRLRRLNFQSEDLVLPAAKCHLYGTNKIA